MPTVIDPASPNRGALIFMRDLYLRLVKILIRCDCSKNKKIKTTKKTGSHFDQSMSLFCCCFLIIMILVKGVFVFLEQLYLEHQTYRLMILDSFVQYDYRELGSKFY